MYRLSDGTDISRMTVAQINEAVAAADRKAAMREPFDITLICILAEGVAVVLFVAMMLVWAALLSGA